MLARPQACGSVGIWLRVSRPHSFPRIMRSSGHFLWPSDTEPFPSCCWRLPLSAYENVKFPRSTGIDIARLSRARSHAWNALKETATRCTHPWRREVELGEDCAIFCNGLADLRVQLWERKLYGLVVLILRIVGILVIGQGALGGTTPGIESVSIVLPREISATY